MSLAKAPRAALSFAGGALGDAAAAALRRQRPKLWRCLSLAVAAGSWELTEPSGSRRRRGDVAELLDYALFWLFALGLRGFALGRFLSPRKVAASHAGRRLAFHTVGIWSVQRLVRIKVRIAPFLLQHVLAFLWVVQLAVALDKASDLAKDKEVDTDVIEDGVSIRDPLPQPSLTAEIRTTDFAPALPPQALEETLPGAIDSSAEAAAAEVAASEPLGAPPSIQALDRLAAKALATLQEHVMARDFEPMPSDPKGHAVQLGQKSMKKTSMPAVRGQWIIDTADLPGDPLDQWSHLAECAAALISYETAAMIDFEIETQQTLVVAKSATVCWQAMRKNALGLMYDYMLANTMEVAEDRISIAACSLPAHLLDAISQITEIPNVDGYTRNVKHLSGLDVRSVGRSERGIQLQCTGVIHMDVEGLNFVVKKFATPTMATALKNMLVRLQEVVVSRLRPEDVTTSCAGVPETLFALPAVFGKPLRVPYYMYSALANRLHDHGAMPAPALPGPQGTFLAGPVPDAMIEDAAKEAMAKAREFFSTTSGWEAQKDLGSGTQDIVVDIRAVPKAKLPCIRCRRISAVPERYGDNLRLAVFEASAIWFNHSTFFLLDTVVERNMALKWCPTATAVLSSPGRCSGRSVEVSLEHGGGATIYMALGAISTDYAKKSLISKDVDLEITDRINIMAVRFRAFHDGGDNFIEVTTLTSIMGDSVPRLLPASLVKGAVMMLQPGKLIRWQAFFSSGHFPAVIDTVSCSPRIPSVEAMVGGKMWRVEAGLHASLKPLLDTL